MSTVKLFILIVVVFVLLMVFVVGFNPFSFGDAYFRPRATPPAPASGGINVILQDNAAPSEARIDR